MPVNLNTRPNKTFEDAARKAGASVDLCWEQRGPKNTWVAWQSCYLVNRAIAVIVQTYEGDGFEVFTPLGTTVDVAPVIADALARCGVKVPEVVS